ERRGEVITAGQLADRRVAEVGVVLIATGHIELQICDRRNGKVNIRRIVVAVVRAGIGQCETRVGLRAFLVARGGIAGRDHVSIVAALQSERRSEERRVGKSGAEGAGRSLKDELYRS